VRVFLARRRWGAVIYCSLLLPKAGAMFAAIYLCKELSYICYDTDIAALTQGGSEGQKWETMTTNHSLRAEI
jgi:hypothetical protein